MLKHLKRGIMQDRAFIPSDQGMVFRHSRANKYPDIDMTGYRCLYTSVDTFKQLFNGALDSDFYLAITKAIEEGQNIVSEVFPGMEDFTIQKSGKKSGYQYILQNMDIGLTVLVKDWFKPADEISHHLKIECSPWFIAERSPEYLDNILQVMAQTIFDKNTVEANKCEIHLAVDFQGWKPGKSFVKNFKSTSSKRAHYQGIERVDFTFFGANHIYGDMETYTAGSRNNLQMCLYDKAKEAKQNQRLDYYLDKWKSHSGYGLLDDDTVYDPNLPVYRLEVRLHHKVVKQFSEGIVNSNTGETCIFDFNNFQSMVPHLAGLWQYSLTSSFKYTSTRRYFHPVWTLLLNSTFAPPQCDLIYQRHYKSAQGFSGKWIDLARGNLISLFVYFRKDFDCFWEWFSCSPIYDEFISYYHGKGKTVDDIRSEIKLSMAERKLKGLEV